ncbi:MAG TPA: Na+/H+ antiporter NhaC family protein [Kiritimatiellia bacterium]|nr:Na+/H+ antiporter NhaC family protein [Kiritimatiellia bacterium]HPS09124.1 Na+/H+ antiporter NhaC family protein [Kiritimatiellia bacterium]
MDESPVNTCWRNPKRWLLFALLSGITCLVFASLPTSPPALLGSRPVGHWSSVLPPLITIIVAVCFRSLVGALTTGLALGCFLSYWPNVLMALPLGIRDFVWVNFRQQFNLYIFGFLAALIGLIHVAYCSGGIHGLVRLVERVAKGPRSTCVSALCAGLVVFFDDYSNTIVVGATMRGLTDRWRVSREKLAYLVDSTSAPVAGVAVFSTWIAFEIFLLSDAAAGIKLPLDGYAMFLAMLPFRFYCYGTLLLVLLTSMTGRDFGPMYKAERRAALEGKVYRDGAHFLSGGNAALPAPAEGTPCRWINAALPIAVVVLGTLGAILVLGRAKLLAAGQGFAWLKMSDWRAAMGMVTNPAVFPGGAMKVLFAASLTGGLVAIFLSRAQNLLTWRRIGFCYARTVPALGMASFILIMSWGMSKICTVGVHTDTYLISLMGEHVPLAAFPLLVFLVASGMSFATGTSFGTMGILIPMVLPLAHALGAYEEPNRVIFWLAAAAVMDGAIFGDHCSPISDTTILSSLSSGCDHLDHVATQLPYALTVTGIAATGYIAVAMGLPGWTYFVFCPAAALAILFGVGRRVPSPLSAA